MIRRWLSNFLKRNQSKLKDVGIKLIIVAIVVFIATIIVSFNNNSNNQNATVEEVYKPTETIIKGSDISKKQYQTDKTLVDTFLEYCNNGKVEEAYSLLSDECKEYKYSSLYIFKASYYNDIFKTKKQFNLQSWISTSKYTTYKIRYTNDILATGNYDESEIYQDYITLAKNNENEKISIGSFITSEKMNKTTKTSEIEAKVTKKNIYIEDEEYEIYITNNSNNTVLLDTLESSNNIKLVTDIGNTHKTYVSKLLKSELTIKAGQTKKLTIKFKKLASNSNESKYIEFYKVIKNYESYSKEKENYTDILDLKINI